VKSDSSIIYYKGLVVAVVMGWTAGMPSEPFSAVGESTIESRPDTDFESSRFDKDDLSVLGCAPDLPAADLSCLLFL